MQCIVKSSINGWQITAVTMLLLTSTTSRRHLWHYIRIIEHPNRSIVWLFRFFFIVFVWFGLVFFASVFFLKLIVNSLIYKIIFNFIVYLYEREEEREREIEYFYFGSSFTFHFCKFHIVEHTLYDDCLCSTFVRFFSFSVVSVFAAHYFDFNRSSKHFAILLLRIFHQRQSFHLLLFPRFQHGVSSISMLQCAYSITNNGMYSTHCVYSLISSAMKVRNHFRTVFNRLLPLRRSLFSIGYVPKKLASTVKVKKSTLAAIAPQKYITVPILKREMMKRRSENWKKKPRKYNVFPLLQSMLNASRKGMKMSHISSRFLHIFILRFALHVSVETHCIQKSK